ncbi:hypothetical protein BWGOE2_54710 [Bacillus mycoides]|nr:hypothetical protein BWGOE2_54710 [Bacillus mycoides]OFD38160.1 hypothetical protein BWGOE1_54990 [Bacillus mycoides]OFD54962.1 hypothetical protein BWGOE6_55370 [Bacillus mycoides]
MNKLPNSMKNVVEKIKNIEIPNISPEPSAAGVGGVGERKTLGELFSAVKSETKGTGNTVHRSEIDEVIKNNYDKDRNLINRSIVPKGYDSVEEFKEVVGLTETYLNAKTKNNILNKPLAGGTHVKKGIDFDILGFPIFKGDDVKFSLKLEKDFYIMKDTDQFKECTKMVKEAIEKGKIPKDLFTQKQLAQINDGLPRIDGLVGMASSSNTRKNTNSNKRSS